MLTHYRVDYFTAFAAPDLQRDPALDACAPHLKVGKAAVVAPLRDRDLVVRMRFSVIQLENYDKLRAERREQLKRLKIYFD